MNSCWLAVQDGRSSGLTAPNGPSQSALIRAALKSSRAAPAEVGLVSIHGTGTPLGDPIEVGALGQAFAAAGGRTDGPMALLSNKSCYGHTEGTAGAVPDSCFSLAPLCSHRMPFHHVCTNQVSDLFNYFVCSLADHISHHNLFRRCFVEVPRWSHIYESCQMSCRCDWHAAGECRGAGRHVCTCYAPAQLKPSRCCCSQGLGTPWRPACCRASTAVRCCELPGPRFSAS